jgi:hypothetical protein
VSGVGNGSATSVQPLHWKSSGGDMMKRKDTLTYGCCFFVATIVLAGYAPGQTVGGPDIKVNQDGPGLNQVETALAVNLAMPGNLLMVYNDQPWVGGPGLGYSYSFDSGATWTDGQFPLPAGLVIYHDPMAACDLNGILYAGGCANNNVVNGNSGVYIYSSVDGGMTWSLPTIVSFDGPQQPATLNDRGHMIVDDNPMSPLFDHVHVTWIKDVGTTGPFSDVYFNTSPPGGTAFIGRRKINDPPTGVGRGHAPHVAAALDGLVYVTWIDYDVTVSQSPGIIYLDVSYDGGVSWNPDIWVGNPLQIVTLPRVFTDGMAAGTQGDTAPTIAVSPLDPQEICIVYPADSDGAGVGDEGNIFFIKSPDRGVSWFTPVQINQPPFDTGHQFAPWIDIKPDGTIDVAWYDGSFTDNNPVLWCVVMSQSRDGGATWTPPGLVSDVLTPAPQNPFATTQWLGEYLALVIEAPWAYVGFASSISDGVGDIYFDRVNNMEFADCDGNGIPDLLDLTNCDGSPWCDDCNGNFVLDVCDVDPTDPDGNGLVSADANGNGIPDECEPTSVGDAAPRRPELRLEQAYPNPFNPLTNIELTVDRAQTVCVRICDPAGRVVTELWNGKIGSGTHRLTWDGTDASGRRVAAGVYYGQLTAEDGAAAVKIVMVK